MGMTKWLFAIAITRQAGKADKTEVFLESSVIYFLTSVYCDRLLQQLVRDCENLRRLAFIKIPQMVHSSIAERNS